MAETTTSGSIPATEAPSTQIDGRRAQQLLERALVLSERGDVPAAVLSCRQAITLNPTAPQAYSMLGLLLERAGDNQGAIAAYERVLQLDPGSLLERESLARLRTVAAQRHTTRNLFVFDEGELFDERNGESPAADGVAADGIAVPAAAQGVAVSSLDGKVATSRAPVPFPSPAVNGAASSAAMSGTAEPRQRDNSPAARAAAAAAASSLPLPQMPPASVGAAPGMVLPPFVETPPPSILQKLIARPSYYFRGVPLAATALVALLFLLWAHHYATSLEIAAVTAPAATPSAMDDRAEDTGTSAPAVATDSNSATSPNATATNPAVAPATSGSKPVIPAAPGTPTPTAASGATHPAPSPPKAPAPHASSPTPGTPVIPSPNTNINPRPNDGGAMPDLPRPRIDMPSGNNEEPTRIVPGSGDGGGASSGGAPLNPGGAPNRDFTRVTPTAGRAAAPPRATAIAARDERIAASGNAGALAAASRAIESGGDTAVRYQQRAQLYLDSGDSVRAINDFQTAIAAYRDMIVRGDRTALARAGIAASQRGIQVARARR
jgi:tetratricopeptide (TPR) repeat protein